MACPEVCSSCDDQLASLQGTQHGASSSRERRWGAAYSQQISILFMRAMKTRRFDSLSTQDIIQFILVGLLSGERPCMEFTLNKRSCRKG